MRQQGERFVGASESASLGCCPFTSAQSSHFGTRQGSQVGVAISGIAASSGGFLLSCITAVLEFTNPRELEHKKRMAEIKEPHWAQHGTESTKSNGYGIGTCRIPGFVCIHGGGKALKLKSSNASASLLLVVSYVDVSSLVEHLSSIRGR